MITKFYILLFSLLMAQACTRDPNKGKKNQPINCPAGQVAVANNATCKDKQPANSPPNPNPGSYDAEQKIERQKAACDSDPSKVWDPTFTICNDKCTADEPFDETIGDCKKKDAPTSTPGPGSRTPTPGPGNQTGSGGSPSTTPEFGNTPSDSEVDGVKAMVKIDKIQLTSEEKIPYVLWFAFNNPDKVSDLTVKYLPHETTYDSEFKAFPIKAEITFKIGQRTCKVESPQVFEFSEYFSNESNFSGKPLEYKCEGQ